MHIPAQSCLDSTVIAYTWNHIILREVFCCLIEQQIIIPLKSCTHCCRPAGSRQTVNCCSVWAFLGPHKTSMMFLASQEPQVWGPMILIVEIVEVSYFQTSPYILRYSQLFKCFLCLKRVGLQILLNDLEYVEARYHCSSFIWILRKWSNTWGCIVEVWWKIMPDSSCSSFFCKCCGAFCELDSVTLKR